MEEFYRGMMEVAYKAIGDVNFDSSQGDITKAVIVAHEECRKALEEHYRITKDFNGFYPSITEINYAIVSAIYAKADGMPLADMSPFSRVSSFILGICSAMGVLMLRDKIDSMLEEPGTIYTESDPELVSLAINKTDPD